LVASGAATLAGCAPAATTTATPATGSAPAPAQADLSTPVAAVRSYLDWVSYAYRVGDSDVASETMTAEELVRVDAYIQYNRQQGRLLDQKLVAFAPGHASVEGTRVVLPAREAWRYSYPPTAESTGSVTPTYTASYDATYTVVSKGPKRWVVASVEARPHGEVK
jgi:hypothetical protein